MSVEEKDVVDFVSEAPDGSCYLTVSDHLEWEGNDEHVLILQEKLNRYLAFVESGELIDKFPSMSGRKIVFDVRFMYAPSDFGFEFLSRICESMDVAGYGFQYNVLRTSIN